MILLIITHIIFTSHHYKVSKRHSQLGSHCAVAIPCKKKCLKWPTKLTIGQVNLSYVRWQTVVLLQRMFYRQKNFVHDRRLVFEWGYHGGSPTAIQA